MDKLKNKVALITGGASGIGEAVTRRFAAEGAKVVIADLDINKGNQIIDSIKQDGYEGIALEVNVAEKSSVDHAVNSALEAFDTIDILFNGAGIHDGYKNALETDENMFDKLMAVNVKGPYLFANAVLPIFLKNGAGSIINVGSQGSKMAGVGGNTYVTSKHAIAGFTKQLAFDFGDKGIRANLLSPGFINTPMTDNIEDPRIKNIPSQRQGEPEELASAALFLASDEASYVQGAELNVDGGWTVGR